jgi:sugar lactone lactonase YvrE
MTARLDARLLAPNDDVATALFDLAAGEVVRVASGDVTREVTLVEPIPTGHKFAVRNLAAGLRIRKYGECIGRLEADVAAGAWVHVHNLVTSARRSADDDRAWSEQVDACDGLRAIGDARTRLGESPVWDAEGRRLYWIDVRETPAIHALEIDSGAQRRWPMAEDVGSIALADRGRLVAGLRSGFAWFDPVTGRLEPIVDPEPGVPQNRLNDGKCDPSGRFWCGSMNSETGTADGSLYVLEADLDCRRVLGDLFTPNGMAWSLDGRTMVLADTRRGVIWSFAFDAASGALGERRVFADLGALPGGPDGATFDSEGFLWSAQFDGACLIRYAPDGRMDRVVRLPVTKPTSCTFGGAGYRQLFVTTATRGLGEDRLRAEPMAGRVLVLDVGVAGLAPVRFRAAAERRAA